MGAFGRSIWASAASRDIQLQYSHIAGVKNVLADALSWGGGGGVLTYILLNFSISVSIKFMAIIFIQIFYIISGSPLATTLLQSASQRVLHGYRRSTVFQYCSQCRLFLALATYLQISDISSPSFFLIFVEFLHLQGVKIPTIRNYILAVKHYFLMYSFSLRVFHSRRLHMLMHSISINATYTPCIKQVSLLTY